MDNYRYPIGQFEPIQNPTSEQRNKWIMDVSEMPKILRTTVQDLTMEQLLTEYRPSGWTIQQIIHHLADNDMNSFIRFKKALTEDNPTACSYREDRWAKLRLDYYQMMKTLSCLNCIPWGLGDNEALVHGYL